MRDRGITIVANAAAQSAEHILNFFETLRRELALYVAALNLYDRLGAVGAPVAMPDPCVTADHILECDNLYDVSAD